MKKITVIIVLLALAVSVIGFLPKANAADKVKHWAAKYITVLVKEGIIAEPTDWDAPISAADYAAALSKVVGKEVKPGSGEFVKAEMVKLAVDNSSYSADLTKPEVDRYAMIMANDEEALTEKGKDYVPYMNLGYLPQYQLLTYRKDQMSAWDQPPYFSEACYLLYMLKNPPNRAEDQVITIATQQEPDTLNPYTTTALSATFLWSFTSWGGEVSYGNTSTLYPVYAKRRPTLENGDIIKFKDEITGKDKLKVIWRIKPGLYWPPLPGEEPGSKKHELTVDDVLYGFKESLCPKIQATTRTGLLKYDYVKKIDKYTYEIGYNEEYYIAPLSGLGWSYKARFEKDLFTDPSNFNVREDFIDYTVGPYKIGNWVKNSHIEFVPNPNSWYAQPLVPKIIVKFISDPNTLRINVQSGIIDITTNAFGTQEAAEMENKMPNMKFYYTPSTSYEHICLNQFEGETGKAELFGDKRVRQALLYAIDRERLSKMVSNGIYTPALSWLTPTSKFFNENAGTTYNFDLAKAEKLLDEAGWKSTDVGGRMIRCKDGDPKKPFEFNYKTTEKEYRKKVIEEVVKMWSAIGIKANPEVVSAKILFGGSVLSQHQFEAVEFAWVSYPLRPSGLMWKSDQIPTKENNWAGQNLSGWKGSKENDDILNQIEKIQTDQKLQELLDSQIKIWTDELPLLPLFNLYDIDSATRDIQNIKPTGSQRTMNWNCGYWYRVPQQK